MLGATRNENGTYRAIWAESSQFVFWALGLGERPTEPDVHTLAMSSVSEARQASLNWVLGACMYAHCSAVEAAEAWAIGLTTAKPEDDVQTAYASATVCADSAGRGGSCKQTAILEVKDWFKQTTPRDHNLLAGYYRSWGTADGGLEALGAGWSGPHTNSNFWWEHLGTYRYVGARARRLTESSNCQQYRWDDYPTGVTADLGYWGGATREIVRDPTDFDGTKRGQGELYKYMTNWRTDDWCNGQRTSLGRQWRATSNVIGIRAREHPTFYNQQGRIRSF